MVVVTREPKESEDKLIARFRIKIKTSGIMQEYKERSRHRKKSELRNERNKRLRHVHELERKRNLV